MSMILEYKKSANDENLQAKCEMLEREVYNGLRQINDIITRTERTSLEMIKCISDMHVGGSNAFGVREVKREHDELFGALHRALNNTELAGGI